MARVLLGVCDQTVCAADADWRSNKIGGNPNWVNNVDLSPHVKCGTCRGSVIFVCQLYCPVEEDHRVLYLFLCSNTICVSTCKSWTVIRCQAEYEASNSHLVNKSEVKSVFDISVDDQDWGDEPDALHYLNVEALNLDSERKDATSAAVERGGCPLNALRSVMLDPQEFPFRPFYINVFEEEPLLSDILQHERELLDEYLKNENISLGDITDSKKSGKLSEKESYEKWKITSMNQNQNKFLKKVRECPGQIIRYSHQGHPLVYDVPPCAASITPCRCGSPRTFECQVMPALANYLLASSGVSGTLPEGLEVATVYVYTCSKSCWNNETDKLIYELAIVEKDDSALITGPTNRRGRYKI